MYFRLRYTRDMFSKRRVLAIAVSLLVGAAVFVASRIRRVRNEPSPLPYEQRLILDLPRPFMTRSRLRTILAPVPGQRVLEVGPGTGFYALHTAQWISPEGVLDILDIEQQMLDHTVRRAQELGLDNVIPTQADASALPYPGETFDSGYLVATLGEVPQKERAIAELYRVLKPGGRLVVGEGQPDPHAVSFDLLREMAENAGFTFERRIGGRMGYFASFIVT